MVSKFNNIYHVNSKIYAIVLKSCLKSFPKQNFGSNPFVVKGKVLP